jgi:predicted outer membrane lipoprotein
VRIGRRERAVAFDFSRRWLVRRPARVRARSRTGTRSPATEACPQYPRAALRPLSLDASSRPLTRSGRAPCAAALKPLDPNVAEAAEAAASKPEQLAAIPQRSQTFEERLEQENVGASRDAKGKNRRSIGIFKKRSSIAGDEPDSAKVGLACASCARAALNWEHVDVGARRKRASRAARPWATSASASEPVSALRAAQA